MMFWCGSQLHSVRTFSYMSKTHTGPMPIWFILANLWWPKHSKLAQDLRTCNPTPKSSCSATSSSWTNANEDHTPRPHAQPDPKKVLQAEIKWTKGTHGGKGKECGACAKISAWASETQNPVNYAQIKHLANCVPLPSDYRTLSMRNHPHGSQTNSLDSKHQPWWPPKTQETKHANGKRLKPGDCGKKCSSSVAHSTPEAQASNFGVQNGGLRVSTTFFRSDFSRQSVGWWASKLGS